MRIENRNTFNMRSVGGRTRGVICIFYCRYAIDFVQLTGSDVGLIWN